jgi:lipopolysaccharide/colanic/teichoic acid biosynthesis glycosyltransferase
MQFQKTRGVPETILLSQESFGYAFCKRLLDIVVSLTALILLSPLWLGITLAICLTSPGPAIYRQRRVVGKGGREFTVYKFRTMYVDADDAAHKNAVAQFVRENKAPVVIENHGKIKPVYKIANDPRITPLGYHLRRTGLDEAPQFINVLRGEMSIVGPRPPLYYEYELYNDWHKQRLSVLPGITGLYQVTARSAVSFDEMVRIDLEYIQKRSLWLDLKIMLLTPINVIILRKGGY